MNKLDDQAPKPNATRTIRLYMSPPHPCAYLDEREAITQFIDPAQTINSRLYSQLVDAGFRRSGEYVYRPRCSDCRACIPARIQAQAFLPSRGQRRTWQRNQDLQINCIPAEFSEEHFALYRRYIAARHPGGGMDVADPERYREFLLSAWSDTWCYEFRLGNRLLAVAVIDRLLRGFSAVYTYYDPAYAERGLGTFAVLWEIAEIQRLELSWLYLGYWIEECPKMSYKTRYRPLEIFRDGLWQTYPGR
jgi:arginyl-tRNA--protein-N-Asp/Glu arginylyltransferase